MTDAAFASRVALPPPERHPHGTRARYVAARCRCDACRAANTAYARSRLAAAVERAEGVRRPDGLCLCGVRVRRDARGGLCKQCRPRLAWNGLVPAARARAHLAALSAQGVGRRSVQAATDIGGRILSDISSGARARIRAETERRILAVDAGARADGALVPSAEVRRAVREMLRLGLTKTEIAERLGYRSHALQLTSRRVTVRNAHRVKKLLAEVREEVARSAAMPEICSTCGMSHAPADRQRVLARHLPCTHAEVLDVWPCFYSDGDAGARRFYRDVEALTRRTA